MQISGIGNLSVNKTSKTGQSAKTEKTAENGLTDSFVAQIKEYAKQDAKQNVYMSKGYIQTMQAQMRQYVSSDRAGPESQVMSAIQSALSEKDPKIQFLEMMLEKLSGNCTANVKINFGRQTVGGQSAEIRAANGEVIASYNSLGGGWTEIQTKEEHKFMGEATMIYYQAFRETRAEIANAAQQTAVPAVGSGTTGGFDVKV